MHFASNCPVNCQFFVFGWSDQRGRAHDLCPERGKQIQTFICVIPLWKFGLGDGVAYCCALQSSREEAFGSCTAAVAVV